MSQKPYVNQPVHYRLGEGGGAPPLAGTVIAVFNDTTVRVNVTDESGAVHTMYSLPYLDGGEAPTEGPYVTPVVIPKDSTVTIQAPAPAK